MRIRAVIVACLTAAASLLIATPAQAAPPLSTSTRCISTPQEVIAAATPVLTPSAIADCAELDPHLVRLSIPDADGRLKSKQRVSLVVVIWSSAPAFAQWDDPPQNGNGQPDDAGHNHGDQVAYHVGDHEVRG
jgi:hypothetical protein